MYFRKNTLLWSVTLYGYNLYREKSGGKAKSSVSLFKNKSIKIFFTIFFHTLFS